MEERALDGPSSAEGITEASRLAAVRLGGRLAAVVVLVVSASALAGWILGSLRLRAVLPGLVPMNPVTALSLGAAATGTLFLADGKRSRARLSVVTALAGFALLVGSVKFAGYLFGIDLGFDRWVLSNPRAAGGIPAPIAANTALVLTLAGTALILMASERGRAVPTAQVLATGATVIGLMALLGYAYGARRLYEVGPLVPMALNTAIASMLLGGALLALRPERGFVRVINEETSFGATARRLIPAIPLVLGVLGWARLRGERIGLYDTPTGTALLVAVAVMCCLGLVFWNAGLMGRAEKERRRAEAAVRDLNKQLARNVVELGDVNRELEAFSYSVSHDLRAPLRHVAGFAELLEKHGASRLDEKGARYLATIRSSAQRMGTLIDDLLDFSRIGRTEMRTAPVDLGALVSGVMGDFQSDLERRQVALEIGDLPRVLGDAALLRMVFTNLVSNALKYSGKQARAALTIGSVVPSDGQAVVFVRDNGVGFDSKYADKMFGVFQRLHSAEEFEGTGIGLANVRRIVTRHGGRVWAESSVGQGATFYVSLPAERAQ